MNNTTKNKNNINQHEDKERLPKFRLFTNEEGGIISAMAALTIGLLFARHHLIFGAHPIGIAMVAAMPTLLWPSLIGVIVGSLTLGEDGIILAICSAFTVLLRFFISKSNKGEKNFSEGLMLKMSAGVISGFIVAVYETVVSGLNMTSVLFSISMILVPPLLVFVFSGLFSEDISIQKVIKSDGAIITLKGKSDREKYNIVFFDSLFLLFLTLQSYKKIFDILACYSVD